MKIISRKVLVIGIFFLLAVTEIHASFRHKRDIPIQVATPSSSHHRTSMSHRSSHSSSSRRSSSSVNSGKSDSIPVEVVQPTESTPSSSPPSSSPPSSSPPSESSSSESGSSETGMTSSETSMSQENSSGGSSGNNNKKSHNFSQLAESLGNIPFGIGLTFKILLNYFGEYYIWLDQLTNGLLARILGGSLPCVISMEQDIVCSGTSKNGGVFGIVQSIILGLPSTIMPDFLKRPILLMIKVFINPIMDTLFGGLPEPEKM